MGYIEVKKIEKNLVKSDLEKLKFTVNDTKINNAMDVFINFLVLCLSKLKT
ncbi:hypothetical protein KJD10_04695 (plasmid) [Borreliella valaisiana]|uniref:hypothetical protein n=1 Tax=Borreliella valaisiana TaxID=62088 RepID=UPI002738101F|nr:hypothetical protein [Borreliella valaisiana]WLN25729.1 hypothetical protein KJD10_04695 [Borreliella valaisiana]